MDGIFGCISATIVSANRLENVYEFGCGSIKLKDAKLIFI